ncbi:MAG: hypothetical protein ACRCVV_06900 [Shewanella sp.]
MAKVDEGTEYTHCLSRLQQFSHSKATQPRMGEHRRLAHPTAAPNPSEHTA